MNKKLVFLAVIATALLKSPEWLVRSALINDTQRSSIFYTIPGSALFNHILSTHYVESSLTCGHRCLRNERCLSFNFGTVPLKNVKFLCELSSSDTKRSRNDLQKQSDYDYFEHLASSASPESPEWLVLSALINDTQRLSIFSTIPGSALFNHILSTHYVESSLTCGHRCLRNERCLSFTFATVPLRNSKILCELSSSDTKRSRNDLQKQSDYDYFKHLNSRPGNTCPPQAIAVLPYIDKECNVDTSLIKLSKGERNITHITTASFNPRYMFKFTEAKQVCKLLNGLLASLQQMQAAWNKGFQQCRYGWLAEGITVVPMHELRYGCLEVGLNKRSYSKSQRYDAYCVDVN